MRLLVSGIALLLLAPTTMFFAYYTHVVDTVWYYEWRSWPWTDFTPSLGGITAGALGAAIQERRARFAPETPTASTVVAVSIGLAVTVLLLGVAFARPLLRPLPLDSIRDQWQDGMCLQSTPATCGPCAAATALRSLGYHVSERTLAAEAHTDVGGTLNWLLVRAIRSRGIKAEFRSSSDLDEIKRPAVIGVRLPNGVGHFLTYLGRQQGAYVVADPLSGELLLSGESFNGRYRLQAFAIELSL